uniref:Protein ZBED8like [Pundamilia nyererei] n=1 Tax=Lepeophtheirus salmonis TaxID=72036 RepID=A0A0K2V9L8_LEPSM
MLGRHSGFEMLVKSDVPHIIITQCVLHRHSLATETLPLKVV